jgi:syntaxin 1B/2/3
MIELAELFQDLDNIVIQQDVQIKHIETKAEEVTEDVAQGNVQLDLGIKSAHAARKKKWICFFIILFIVVAVAAAVAAYVVIKNAGNKAAAPAPAAPAPAAPAATAPATQPARRAVALLHRRVVE